MGQHLPYFTVTRTPKIKRKCAQCRSCNKDIEFDEVRIQVAYPTKVVCYEERKGSPSFFVHLDCFIDSPMDYEKSGKRAWKDVIECDPFKMNEKNLLISGDFSKDSCEEIREQLNTDSKEIDNE